MLRSPREKASRKYYQPGGGWPGVGVHVYDVEGAEPVGEVVFRVTPQELALLAERPFDEREVPNAQHRVDAREQFFAEAWPQRLAALDKSRRPLREVVPLRRGD